MCTCQGPYTVRHMLMYQGPRGDIIYALVLFVSSELQSFPAYVVCIFLPSKTYKATVRKKGKQMLREELEQRQKFHKEIICTLIQLTYAE